MLSGARDVNQAWRTLPSATALERVFGFTHTADDQHQEHLDAFEAMKLIGAPTFVDAAAPPYGGSHRLETKAATGDGHSSTEAGGASPKSAGKYLFEPAWKLMYNVK